MEDKKAKKQSSSNKPIKEEKIETKAYSKVNSKDKQTDLFANVKETKKVAKKEEKDDFVKGTVTVNKKINFDKIDKKEKSKGKSGKWIALVIAIIIIAAIVAGILFFLKTPYFAVMKSFNSIKSGNIQVINEYLSYEELMASLVKSLNVGEEMGDLEKNCFSDLTYKINTVTVEGDTATVNIDTTNKNFRNALTKWNQKIYQKFINGEEISNNQGIMLLNECLSDKSIGTISTNKDLTLNKVDGKWKVVINTNLQDAIFPGRSDLANSIDALINE